MTERPPLTEADLSWLPDDDDEPANKATKAAGSARAKSPGNGADADPRPAHGRKAGASGLKCVVCGGTAADKSGGCLRCGTELVALSEPEPKPKPKPAPGVRSRGDDPRPAPDADDELPALDIRSEWATPPPARQWLVDGWLPASRIAMLAGRGAAGKSQLALQLAYAITSDFDGITRSWFAGGPEIAGGAR